MKKHSRDIGMLLLCVLFSWIIITICCQSSFLYPFNEEIDVSCFYTVARCILNGKVLYRDIYEHKGLYTYFIYAIAYFFSSANYLGIYYIEVLCATVFSFASYKTCKIITSNSGFSVVTAIAMSVITYTSVSYQEGGFVEDFSIPLIGIIIYLVVRWFIIDKSKNKLLFYYFIIGVLSGVMFWIKYTMIGCVVGLILYTIVMLVRKKKIVLLLGAGLTFIMGFILASIPCLIYFVSNNAVTDMLKVYFYNMIFIYNGTGNSSTGNLIDCFIDGSSAKYIFNSSGIIILLLSDILFGKKEGKDYKKCIAPMYIASVLVIARGVLYDDCYQVLSLFPFLVFGFIYGWDLICLIFNNEDIHNDISKIVDFVKEYGTRIVMVIFVFLAICQSLRITSNSFGVVLSLIYVVVLSKIVDCLYKKLNNHVSDEVLLWGKYILALICFLVSSFFEGKYQGDNNMIGVSLLVLVFYWLWNDHEEIYKYIQIENIKKYITTSRFFVVRITLLGTVFIIAYCLIASGEIGYVGQRYEDTVQYKFTNEIEKSGIENPIIEGYGIIDIGLFNTLNILPQTKYYGYYNIDLPEISAEKQMMIGDGRADFVYTTGKYIDSSMFDKYKVVSVGSPYSKTGKYMSYYLLQRMS